MRRWTPALAAGRGRPVSTPPSGDFTQNFTAAGADANPIGSPWTNPAVSGFFNMQIKQSLTGGVPGERIACGTVASDTGTPDCYAIYADITGNYEIEAELFRSTSLNASIGHEWELHVGFVTNGPTIVQTCEWLVNAGGAGQLMRWNGTNGLGDVFYFEDVPILTGSPSPGIAPATGHRMKFKKVGTAGTLYYDSGSGLNLICTCTLPYSGGSPAIATFNRGGGENRHNGFRSVTVRPL